MAKTVEMSCSLGRKLSDGDYGSMDFFVSEKIALDPGDDPEVEWAALKQRVLNRLVDEVRARGLEP